MIKIIIYTFLALFAACSQVNDPAPEPGLPEVGKELTFWEQLKRLHELKRQGKELRLIIGRKNDESGHGPLPAIANGEWVFNDTDRSQKNSVKDPIELEVDFTGEHLITMESKTYDVSLIREIEDETFSQIVVDSSVWKFLAHELKRFVYRVHKKLKPGGKLYIPEESGTIKGYLKPLPGGFDLEVCDNDPDCVIGIRKNVDAPENISAKIYDEIAKRYQRYFTKKGFSSFIRHINKPYVIKSYGSSRPINYYEITK